MRNGYYGKALFTQLKPSYSTSKIQFLLHKYNPIDLVWFQFAQNTYDQMNTRTKLAENGFSLHVVNFKDIKISKLLSQLLPLGFNVIKGSIAFLSYKKELKNNRINIDKDIILDFALKPIGQFHTGLFFLNSDVLWQNTYFDLSLNIYIHLLQQETQKRINEVILLYLSIIHLKFRFFSSFYLNKNNK